MQKKSIPERLWTSLSKTLQDKLAGILLTLNLPNLHVIDTRGVLTPARLGSTGQDADWDNEVHPTREGYNKLARKWDDRIESALQHRRQTLIHYPNSYEKRCAVLHLLTLHPNIGDFITQSSLTSKQDEKAVLVNAGKVQ